MQVRFARQFAGRRVRFSYHWRLEETNFNRDRTIEGILSCGPIIPGHEFCWLLIDGRLASPLSTNSEAIYRLDPCHALWTDSVGVSNGDHEVVAIDDTGNAVGISLEVSNSIMDSVLSNEDFSSIATASTLETVKNGVIIHYDALSSLDFERLNRVAYLFSGPRCSLYSTIVA